IIPGRNAPANAAVQDLFAIQLVADAQANRDTLAVINRLKSGPIVHQYEMSEYLNVFVHLPPAAIPQIAARPEVVSIQTYVCPTPQEERQDQIIAGNITGNSPSAPGYLSFLATQGFTQAQFTASNFAVDMSDSGIDNGTTSPNHFGLFVNGTRPGTSRVIYNRLVGTPNAGSTVQGCDGHGTLNTHIVAGFNNLSGAPHADAAGFRFGLGVCPFVKVGSSVIFDPTTFTSPNFGTLQSLAYANGARISSNSWGAAVAGIYDAAAQSYDTLVRDAQSGTGGNQEMVIVFSAGNSGPGAGTMASPASAKNVITVGASENVQAFGGA